ncbi:MAG: chemotaxis protein CheV [Pseudomonadales bacterium]|nr:chemotaxis protein CheV [Pseudomonadales bacterium]
MAGVLDVVDQRTQLVGANRLELLMFKLRCDQVYAINVFKVQEVQQMPKLTLIPKRHSVVAGVTHVRGQTIPVIDLSHAIRRGKLTDVKNCNIIIAEYNCTVQAFMVGSVDRIVNMNWDEVIPPPAGTGNKHFLTAITRYEDRLIEIIDVEKVLARITDYDSKISEGVLEHNIKDLSAGMRVLLVDDSSVGLSQGKRTLDQLGLEVVTETDGARGIALLRKWVAEGYDFEKNFLMLVTDAEMPEMDGYMLSAACRNEPALKDIHIILHTSLSGSFNVALSDKVGCDQFISKFQPDELAKMVQERIKKLNLTRRI